MREPLPRRAAGMFPERIWRMRGSPIRPRMLVACGDRVGNILAAGSYCEIRLASTSAACRENRPCRPYRMYHVFRADQPKWVLGGEIAQLFGTLRAYLA